jgi:hypothetical protein
MKAARAWLEGAAACGLVAFPPVGVVLFSLHALLAGRIQLARGWVWLWSVLVILNGWLWIQGQTESWLVLQAGLALVLAALVRVRNHRAVWWGIMAGLMLIVGFGAIERELSRRLWLDMTSPQTWTDTLRGISRLSGDSPGWRRNGIRLIEKTWQLAPATDNLELSFETRLLEGDTDWQWYTNHPDTRQQRLEENGVPFTRITNPQDDRRNIVRRIRTDEDVAGRIFRASLELRSPVEADADGCGGLQLRTFEASFQHCQSLNLNENWQRFTIQTSFPPEARQPALELIINRIDAPYFDIRHVLIEELTAGEWVQLPPAEPAGVHVRLPLADRHIFSQPSLNIIPTDEWQRHSLIIEDQALLAQRDITFLLQLEAGSNMAVRNISLTTNSARPPSAYPFVRSELWFPQANLAGHTFVTTGLLLLILKPVSWAQLGAVMLILGAVFFTGSRTAWLAALIGSLWSLWLISRRRLRLFIIGGLFTAFAISFLVWGGGTLTRLRVWQFQDGNTVTRVEIWRSALAMTQDRPWLGLQGEAFDAAWPRYHPSDRRDAPPHAHNIWLQFGASYGYPGLLTAGWLTVGLLVLAWQWGRWQGLGLIVPVLIMQIFDYTLFYSGVLFAVILGLNTLRARKHDAQAKQVHN